MHPRGKFITLEGSEGAGKSTNLATMCEYLRDQNIDFYQTREPGGTPFAEALRENLLHHWQEEVDGLTELLVVFAARNQHLKHEIEPRLTNGQWVICDRFTDASYAYQGAARGLPLATVAQLETLVQGDLRPDLTLYLDLDPAIGMARIADREQDRLEQEKEAFFTKVRQGYQQQAAKHSRIKIIDASQSLPAVSAQLTAVLAEFLLSSGLQSSVPS